MYFIRWIKGKKGKGFTLIELLSIIVILAIIAVITVPIILNIIENSKTGATKDSVYGYKDAITNYYVNKLTTDGNFKFDNKNYSVQDLKNAGLSVSGKEPGGNSWVSIVDNNVVDGCLQYDDYMVRIGSDYMSDVLKGECDTMTSWSQTVFPTVMKSDGTTIYYDSTWIKNNPIFYNPVTNSKCTDGASGCMRWYAYSESKGNVNMLLDHNFINEQWEDEIESTNTSSPSIILSVIGEQTSNWSDRLIRNDSYSASWNYNNVAYSFTIDYTGKKARLISAEEISASTNNNIWNRESEKYYFGSGSSVEYGNQSEEQQAVQQKYSWLFNNTDDCITEGCDFEQEGAISYWTSTPKTNTSNRVWCVCNGGCLEPSLTNESYIGIRPVISLPKSIVY